MRARTAFCCGRRNCVAADVVVAAGARARPCVAPAAPAVAGPPPLQQCPRLSTGRGADSDDPCPRARDQGDHLRARLGQLRARKKS